MLILPHGKLRCTSSNGTDQFFIDGKYISKKNMDLIKKVAQREYYEELSPVLRNTISKLQKVETLYESHTLDNCYIKQCDARKKLVVSAIKTRDELIAQFNAEKYEHSVFDKNDKTEYYTARGERVRSKSEIIIANELYRYNVPYHYEMPIQLQYWEKIVTRRPDFTVINPRNGKIYIFEHFGMMDNIDYVEANMKKIELYEKNGYLIGKNLVFTHETSKQPLNIAVVDSYIENFFV